MDKGVLIWLIIFALSAAVFFLVAAVVTVKGLGDLRTLLRHSRKSGRSSDDTASK
jgi:hypothetical protein